MLGAAYWLPKAQGAASCAETLPTHDYGSGRKHASTCLFSRPARSAPAIPYPAVRPLLGNALLRADTGGRAGLGNPLLAGPDGAVCSGIPDPKNVAE